MKNITFINPPKECDICHKEIKEKFVDGGTVWGPWANMCPECFGNYGIGLGTGRGQEYKKNESGDYVKIAG